MSTHGGDRGYDAPTTRLTRLSQLGREGPRRQGDISESSTDCTGIHDTFQARELRGAERRTIKVNAFLPLMRCGAYPPAIRRSRAGEANRSKRTITEEATDHTMRTTALVLLSTAVLLIGCSDPRPDEHSTSEKHTPAVGSDRDAHGCIPSAGYRWCATTNQCERPWEIAKAKGFEPTAEAFEQYCQRNTQQGTN